MSLFSGSADAPSSSHILRVHRNNGSIISGLVILRIAPKIIFSSIVKPVCLPLPDDSVNDAESTKDLLFASHAAVNDENDGETVTESSVTSLITVFHHRRKDLSLVTDQRLEIPNPVCTQILKQSGMEWMLNGRQPVMCALNSPLFTLNCRVII